MIKSFSTLLLSLCLTLCGVLDAQAQTPAAKADKLMPGQANGFNLYQTSSVMGDFDVFVSSQGIKIFDRKNIRGVVAKAPLWDVYVYNHQTKRYCKYPFSKYPGLGKDADDTTGGYNLIKLPVVKGKAIETHGIEAWDYLTTPAFEKKQLKDFERESADPRFVQNAELVIAAKASVPSQAAAILARYYNLPLLDRAVPLEFSYVNLKGERHNMLITTSMTPMKTWANGFDYPRDYKLVADKSKLEDKIKEKPTRKIEDKKVKVSPEKMKDF